MVLNVIAFFADLGWLKACSKFSLGLGPLNLVKVLGKKLISGGKPY